jgi:hypothetical protein
LSRRTVPHAFQELQVPALALTRPSLERMNFVVSLTENFRPVKESNE